ncbi:hypothetical protein Mal15_15600 [Stieleria maiorica]|uniref:GAF domain-containing protein n=1 Tax=Stieleria maiorica TaxID=2795974 RepID=A0A5B9MBQ6_9BACT|nr:GAF domain-containing protein [Stieleria maiorica]QEF97520.1 hypothetical protein Mal15_15600 [Stieleria maiorica]
MIAATSNHSFLTNVIALEVDPSGTMPTCGIAVADRAVAASIESGLPTIKQTVEGEAEAVAICIPIYRAGQITSAVIMIGNTSERTVGVMEIWQPIGEHDELNLTQGYFGPLERFQNVSSFVRFEKGSGLPGQVWRNLGFVIHDNLPTHAGFLRAAGASAESLQVAVGIPVFGDDFLATAVLISSDSAPIARGYEVWRCGEDEFLLESSAYQRLEQSLMYEGSATVPMEGTLPGLAFASGAATISEDPEIVFSGRPIGGGKPCKGVAIPFFEQDRITNILTLLL